MFLVCRKSSDVPGGPWAVSGRIVGCLSGFMKWQALKCLAPLCRPVTKVNIVVDAEGGPKSFWGFAESSQREQWADIAQVSGSRRPQATGIGRTPIEENGLKSNQVYLLISCILSRCGGLGGLCLRR